MIKYIIGATGLFFWLIKSKSAAKETAGNFGFIKDYVPAAGIPAKYGPVRMQGTGIPDKVHLYAETFPLMPSDEGQAVEALQNALNQRYEFGLSVTGLYDAETTEALRALGQSSCSLEYFTQLLLRPSPLADGLYIYDSTGIDYFLPEPETKESAGTTTEATNNHSTATA